MDLKDYIANVPDFPTKGVLYRDITPMLQDAQALQYALQGLVALTKGKTIDKVVSMESRGFILGAALAERLRAGFVPVRKPGKLPRPTVSRSYDLEYGTDSLQMHKDAIAKGDRILVHDDVLATGGTARAVKHLVEGLGGEIVQFNFLIQLTALNGAAQLHGTEVASLVAY